MGGSTQSPENIKSHDLVAEMESSYLDYSMSVIVQRALPDARDGLKPVHRRILFAMSKLGLASGRPHKKSATVVGEVLGKYHPHGDSAVYDAMVRMAQDFSMGHPLVDGQGNFGSIDGDSAAAYRYTEARLSRIADSMLTDLDSDTVDFRDNYDGREQEPTVLPAALPNLLVNGSEGIAVGMSTHIPPHNLREVGAAIRLLCEDPDASDDEVYRLIKGPDFPTGGLILRSEGIDKFKKTGIGRMINRARGFVETGRGGKTSLVFTEVPYGIVKGNILDKISGLVRLHRSGSRSPDAWSDWISGLRDESDREGIRIVVELKKGVDPAKVLDRLYTKTTLQMTYGGRLLALVNNEPHVLSLRDALTHFIDHRLVVIVRRANHDLREARHRAHILEGLLIAIDSIERVVELIRKSKKKDTARTKLRREFSLSEIQADAILNLRLHRLTALDVTSLKEELKQKKILIKELEELLASPDMQRTVVRDETEALVAEFGKDRRTEIVGEEAADALLARVADEFHNVYLSSSGVVRSVPEGDRARWRVKDGEVITRKVLVKTGERVVLFSSDGQAHSLYPEDINGGSGQTIGRIVPDLGKADVLMAAGPRDFETEDASVLFVSEQGYVKKTELAEFSAPRAGGIAAVNVGDGDRLVAVLQVTEDQEILLASSGGKAIRFPVTDVPHHGRTARGVLGMKLRSGDRVVSGSIIRGHVAVLTADGQAKLIDENDFPSQRRNGQGVILTKVNKATGPVVLGLSLADRQNPVLVGSDEAWLFTVEDLTMMDRNTRGEAADAQVPDGLRYVLPV